MSAWMAAAGGLLPPLLFAVIAAGRGAAPGRLVAMQLATSLATLLGMVFAVADDQSSSLDLALAFALLGLPATLVFALFQERWL